MISTTTIKQGTISAIIAVALRAVFYTPNIITQIIILVTVFAVTFGLLYLAQTLRILKL